MFDPDVVQLIAEWIEGDGPVRPVLTAEAIVGAVTTAYLLIPVEQRMEAMGMALGVGGNMGGTQWWQESYYG